MSAAPGPHPPGSGPAGPGTPADRAVERGARHGTAAPRGLTAPPSSRGGRFTRLFPHLPRGGPGIEALEALADRLDPAAVGSSRDNTDIPAGFTYLGQFIDHDLTLDATSKIDRDNDPHALANFRTPRFDLDSLYGSGPADQPFLYDWSGPHRGVKLLVGRNPAGGGWADDDLPRTSQERAAIGDARNDEHLIISQLHLLFIRFHNRVVDALHARDATLTHNALFDAAHEAVRWHYQWIVTHDFLRAVAGGVLWTSLRPRLDGRRGSEANPTTSTWNLAAIPVEFSAAVFRFGHSMVRPEYPINAAHEMTPVPILSTGHADGAEHLGGFRRLPERLQIEWPRFFGPAPIPSMVLDHRLTMALASLPPDGAQLARLNLLRGHALGLPSGRDIARAMGHDALNEGQLFPPGLWDRGEQDRLRDAILASPPLWFYVLREAVAHGNKGAHLGPVGGRIVAEVLIGLLEADPSSYLNAPQPWTPATDGLPSTMTELVDFTLRDD